MKTYDFQAEIIKHEGMDAAYILFPYNVENEFDTKGQVKVKAIFDGDIEYRGSLANMGLDNHCLGITKKIRATLGKQAGDYIHVSLQKDIEQRIVEIPDDLDNELQKNNLKDTFKKKSYSQQKKSVDEILTAKKDETRARRITKLISELKSNPRQ